VGGGGRETNTGQTHNIRIPNTFNKSENGIGSKNPNFIHDEINITLYFRNFCNHSVQNIVYIPLQNLRAGKEWKDLTQPTHAEICLSKDSRIH
jgi:hypothetical protein